MNNAFPATLHPPKPTFVVAPAPVVAAPARTPIRTRPLWQGEAYTRFSEHEAIRAGLGSAICCGYSTTAHAKAARYARRFGQPGNVRVYAPAPVAAPAPTTCKCDCFILYGDCKHVTPPAPPKHFVLSVTLPADLLAALAEVGADDRAAYIIGAAWQRIRATRISAAAQQRICSRREEL